MIRSHQQRRPDERRRIHWLLEDLNSETKISNNFGFKGIRQIKQSLRVLHWLKRLSRYCVKI